MYLFKDVFLNLLLVDQKECIGRFVNHDTVSSLSSILKRHFLEARIPLLAPRAFWSKNILQMAPLLTVSLSYEIINEEGIFVLSLMLLLTKTTNSVKCFFLYALENFVFSVIIFADLLKNLNRVCFSSLLILIKCP